MADLIPADPGTLDPLKEPCSCWLCRHGRMCRRMTEIFRACARRDQDRIAELETRIIAERAERTNQRLRGGWYP